MSAAWRELVTRNALGPDLSQVGPASREVRFAGRVQHGWLSVGFRPGDETEPVRVLVHRSRPSVLLGDADYRVVPRGYVPGYRGGHSTGDTERDARLLVLAHESRALAHFDERVWETVDALVGSGRAWLVDDTVGLDPRAVAGASDADAAHALVREAVRVLLVVAQARGEHGRSQR